MHNLKLFKRFRLYSLYYFCIHFNLLYLNPHFRISSPAHFLERWSYEFPKRQKPLRGKKEKKSTPAGEQLIGCGLYASWLPRHQSWKPGGARVSWRNVTLLDLVVSLTSRIERLFNRKFSYFFLFFLLFRENFLKTKSIFCKNSSKI